MLALMPTLLASSEWAELRQEALALRSTAVPRYRDDSDVSDDGRLYGRVLSLIAPGGPAITAVHTSAGHRCRLERLVGRRLSPTLAGYLYYRRDDFLTLHRDQPICDVVVLVWLAGPGGPLYVHHDLEDWGTAELSEIAERWKGFPPGGEAVDLREGPIVLVGAHRVPHHRPPHADDEELVVGAMCFTRQLGPEVPAADLSRRR